MIQAYIDGKREASYHGSLVTLLIFGFAALGVVTAFMVFFGWMPLAERANILRSNRNPLEYIVALASVLFALGCARTAIGLRQREQSSLRWSQWMYFVTIMIGGAILLSVIIPVGLKFSLLLGQDIDLRTIIENDVGSLAPLALSIGEALISISLLVAAFVSLIALLVFLIPPLEPLREMEGIRLIVAPPRRFVLAIVAVLAVGVICILVAGAYVVPLYPGTTTIRDAENHRLLAGPAFLSARSIRL